VRPHGLLDALNLLHQTTLRAHAEQIAHEQHLEQHHRIKCRTAVVWAIKRFALLAEEGERDAPVDQPEQVVLGNRLLKREHFQLELGRLRRHFKCQYHVTNRIQQSPRIQGLCQQS
jgi:hypothetical protein